jgi:Predicted permeases
MTLIDRYLVSETWKRLAVALAVVLVSLVIERIIRLFDLVTMKGGPVSMVWEMALMLVPHYLGLALPAGFFISIFLVVARLGEDNEFDALLNSGISPRRFAMPFFAISVLLVALSVGLYGYLQPYSRYAYRAIHYLASNIPWGATVPERSFATVDKDVTVTTDRVDGVGRRLSGVFIHMTQDGREVTVTAESAELLFGPEHRYYRLKLYNGTQLVTGRTGASATHFDELLLQREFITTLPLFRPRGEDTRELTLDELAHENTSPASVWPKAEVRAEFHARLARAASLLFVPFLTIPLALAAKRSRRGAGVVVGAAALIVYHYVLQTTEGMAEMGRIPVFGLWVAVAAFAGLSLALFWRAQRRPGENPLDRVFDLVNEAIRLGGQLGQRLGALRS